MFSIRLKPAAKENLMTRKKKQSRAILPVILSVGMCATSVGIATTTISMPAYAHTSSILGKIMNPPPQTRSNADTPASTQQPDKTKEQATQYPTVTFVNGNSTIATVQVKKGSTIGTDIPTNVNNSGHTFLGWSTTQGATDQSRVDFTSTTTVSANKTVYAVFKKNDTAVKQSTVTFNSDGSCYNVVHVDNGKSLGTTMPANPTKTGYTFLGWSTTQGATDQSHVDFTSATTVSADKTVYAVFTRTIIKKKVWFKNLTRKRDDDYSIDVEQGQPIPNPPTGHAVTGYKFIKWCTKEDGSAPAFDFKKRITKDITIYAIIKKKPPVIDITPTPLPDDRPILPPNPDGPNPDDPIVPDDPLPTKHTVTFKNGDQVHSIVPVDHNASIPALNMPNNPTREGYTFRGWSTKPNANDASDANFSSNTPVTSDTTVYAVFEKIQPVQYDLTFMNDDAWLATYYVEQGKKLDANRMPATPTKAGYTFLGWSTTKNASAPDFSADTPVTTDTTVYAVFKATTVEREYNVVFSSDDALLKTVYVKAHAAVSEANMPTTPTKDGYKFLGWSTSKDASVADFSADTPVTADTNVYAVFQKDEHPTKTEILVGKMTYTSSATLAFKERKKISDPVDGKKVTDGTGTVIRETPAKDGVTEVGNKEIVTEDIAPSIKYKADSSLEYKAAKETTGTKGTRTKENFYGIDTNTGALEKMVASNAVTTTPAVDTIIAVGNVKRDKKDIPFGTQYIDDDTLDEGKTIEETQGKNGSETIVTTYKVDPTKGLTDKVAGTSTEDKVAAVDAVIRRGTKKVTPKPEPAPQPPIPPKPVPQPQPQPPTPPQPQPQPQPQPPTPPQPGPKPVPQPQPKPQPPTPPQPGPTVEQHTPDTTPMPRLNPQQHATPTPAAKPTTSATPKPLLAPVLTSTPTVTAAPSPAPMVNPQALLAPVQAPISPAAAPLQTQYAREHVLPKTGDSLLFASLLSVCSLSIATLTILRSSFRRKKHTKKNQ